MCFSATASFGVAAPLLPVGVYCVHRAARADARWVPFAAYPLAFGLQQVLEGAVWLGIGAGDTAVTGVAALAFLFFALFFWPIWAPLSIVRLVSDRHRRRIVGGFAILGGLYGASLYLPLLLNGDWLNVAVIHRSVAYEPRLIYDGVVHREVLRVVYAAIIVGALFASPIRRIRLFAVLVFASVVAAYLFFDYAFISVWCFFAAILSLCVLHIVRTEAKPVRAAAHPLARRSDVSRRHGPAD